MKSVFLKSASGYLEVGQNSPIRVNCNVGVNSEAGRAYEIERLAAISKGIKLSKTVAKEIQDLF